jgi:LacI family transcriptional regulator
MSAPKKRVRLVDIAERLNITKVSVSKALRNHPDISKETRAIVLRVANEMGYTPNLVARSLSSRRSYTIGVVVPKIAHTFFASVIDSVQRAATDAGYGVLLAVSNENAELERDHLERLLAMRVDGLLVSVSQEAPHLETYERVRESGTPLVFFDRRIDFPDFSSVTVDDLGGARNAVEELIRGGYRKVAHIAGAPGVTITELRRQGYEEALHAHGLPVREEWVREGGFDERHGYQAFQEIAQSGELPDAIFAVTSPTALGAQRAIWEMDPALLPKIRIATFGDSGFDAWSTSPHLTVRQPTEEMGQRAMAILLEMIESEGAAEPQSVVLETQLFAPEAVTLALHGDGGFFPANPGEAPEGS